MGEKMMHTEEPHLVSFTTEPAPYMGQVNIIAVYSDGHRATWLVCQTEQGAQRELDRLCKRHGVAFERPPIDPELNRAILAIAHKLLPQGWGVSPNAPECFEALKAEWSLYGRFDVFDGGCDDTIYCDASVNHAFRAWHDYRHLTENADFTLTGEQTAALRQIADLQDYCWENRISMATWKLWADIIEAEIVGQGRYLAAHGDFPKDQMAFVKAYLVDPSAAIATAF